jgi:hypothetical protein
LDDPLHGAVCSGPGGTGCTNTDNGSFAPLATTNWGFEISPPNSDSGTLTLVFGVPTNEINPALFNLPGLFDNGGGVGTTVFSRTSFYNVTSANLSNFLGLGSFSPTDNFSNLSAGTAGADPGFNGNFLVFTATITGITLDSQGSTTLANDFSLGSNLPNGTFITGLFTDGVTGQNVGTAASGHLVAEPFAAVPGPTAGAGLPGLLAGIFGLVWLAKRRRFNVFGGAFA